jgi:cytoskeletal protein CcmA (bactofilin family)
MRLLMFLKEAIWRIFSKADRFEVLIGGGSVSKGHIQAAGTVKVEGEHTGNIRADIIIILERGSVTGDMQSRMAVIGGMVDGNVSAEESVEVKVTGRLEGLIYSKTLVVAEGGVFNGDASVHNNTIELTALVNSEAAVT